MLCGNIIPINFLYIKGLRSTQENFLGSRHSLSCHDCVTATQFLLVTLTDRPSQNSNPLLCLTIQRRENLRANRWHYQLPVQRNNCMSLEKHCLLGIKTYKPADQCCEEGRWIFWVMFHTWQWGKPLPFLSAWFPDPHIPTWRDTAPLFLLLIQSFTHILQDSHPPCREGVSQWYHFWNFNNLFLDFIMLTALGWWSVW